MICSFTKKELADVVKAIKKLPDDTAVVLLADKDEIDGKPDRQFMVVLDDSVRFKIYLDPEKHQSPTVM